MPPKFLHEIEMKVKYLLVVSWFWYVRLNLSCQDASVRYPYDYIWSDEFFDQGKFLFSIFDLFKGSLWNIKRDSQDSTGKKFWSCSTIYQKYCTHCLLFFKKNPKALKKVVVMGRTNDLIGTFQIWDYYKKSQVSLKKISLSFM